VKQFKNEHYYLEGAALFYDTLQHFHLTKYIQSLPEKFHTLCIY